MLGSDTSQVNKNIDTKLEYNNYDLRSAAEFLITVQTSNGYQIFLK